MPQDVCPPDRHARDQHGRSTGHASRLRRRLGSLLLGVVVVAGLLTALPVEPAQAASGTRGPIGEYVPQRVWQMHQNCIWAAGEMLLDKWTHGSIRVRQSVLRRASHDKKGGSSLYDLSRAIARLTGIRVPFSPGYGDTMAWWQLLDRLDHGGGAVLIGQYGDLPAHFSRWDRSFARRRNSSHAVYIQSYDRVRARVWLMDPLAGGHYPGEWIGVAALHRFATIKDGRVMAAATPARSDPQTAPLTDHAYRLAEPHLAGAPVSGSTVQVQIGLTITAGFPAPAAHRLVGRWTPVVTPPTLTLGRRSPALDPARTPDGVATPIPVQSTTVSAPERTGARGFAVGLPVPAVPGTYRLDLALAEIGHRTAARSFRTMTVEVVPPYAGGVSLPARAELVAGQAFTLKLTLANVGAVDWRTALPQVPPTGGRPSVPTLPATQLVLTWRSAAGVELPAATVPAELAPGHSAKLAVALVAPPEGGAWTLVLDVDNLVNGTLSATGRGLPSMAVTVTSKRPVHRP